jgi:hypothetical protein
MPSNDKFYARIFIQGTGVYVPHDTGTSLLVLFPDWKRANDLGLRDANHPARAICKHHAVVQYDARESPSAPEAWRSLSCQGYWIEVESDSAAQPMTVSPNGIYGAPRLNEVAADAGLAIGDAVDKNLLAGKGEPSKLLAAGLYLDRGVLSPSSEYLGAWRFPRGQGGRVRARDDLFTSVMHLELGSVTYLKLRLRPLKGSSSKIIEPRPVGDELDVWIRHFCKVDERPLTEDDTCEFAAADADFALNFALASKFAQVIARLPVPTPIRSWGEGERGGPIGGDCHSCMCSGTHGTAFTWPM